MEETVLITITAHAPLSGKENSVRQVQILEEYNIIQPSILMIWVAKHVG